MRLLPFPVLLFSVCAAAAHAGEDQLLKRVWGLDALDCPRCHARMTAVAVIEDPAEIARYLAHCGQATVHGRARGPPVDADAA